MVRARTWCRKKERHAEKKEIFKAERMGKQKEPSLGKKGTNVSEKAEAKTCQKKPGSLGLLVSWAKHEIGKETGKERDRSRDDGAK